MEVTMRIRRFNSLLIFGILIIAFLGCQSEDSGKIPVTTSSKEALEDFLKGRDLFERLQGQESLQFLESAIEKDPNFAMAYLFSSFSQPTAQRFFDQLDKAVALKDQVSEGERLWIEGVKAGTDGFPMKQRGIYQNLIMKYPDDERAHNNLGNNFFGTQEYEKAIAEYEQVIRINPEFTQTYNQMGYAYRFLKKYDEAEKAFQKYIQLIPNDPNPYDSYAELLMKRGNFKASIEQYQKALEVNPNFVASHVGIATNQNFLGNYDQARAQLQKLFEMARSDGEKRAARFAMTVSYVDEGKMDKALEELDWQYNLGKSTNSPANMAGDLITIGNIYYEMKKFDKASKFYKDAVETVEASDLSEPVKDNARRFYLYNQARIALRKKDIKTARDKAGEFMNQAQSVNNTFQIWLANQIAGMIAIQEKDYEVAVKSLKRSNLQNPSNLYRLALAYEKLGNKEMAKDYCEQAATHNTLNSMQYAFVRHKAQKMLDKM
jgi:tetratricopeptide (TPR) repeat protein